MNKRIIIHSFLPTMLVSLPGYGRSVIRFSLLCYSILFLLNCMQGDPKVYFQQRCFLRFGIWYSSSIPANSSKNHLCAYEMIILAIAIKYSTEFAISLNVTVQSFVIPSSHQTKTKILRSDLIYQFSSWLLCIVQQNPPCPIVLGSMHGRTKRLPCQFFRLANI